MEIDRDKLEKFCKFLKEDKDVQKKIKKIALEHPDSVAKLVAYELSDFIRRNPDKLAEMIRDIEKEESKEELPVLPKEIVGANLTDAEKKIYYTLLEKAKGKRRLKK